LASLGLAAAEALMSNVDKRVFEQRGAHGVVDSDYRFVMTTCCERVGILDDELDDFYFDPENAGRSVSRLGDAACPFCEAATWAFHALDQPEQVPEHWRWARDGKPRPGSRRG
jgi:hypothetical protein